MAIYGEAFSGVYDQKWTFFAGRVWPFVSRYVRGRRLEAGTWLDLCCGTGALLRLAEEGGFAATGLDVSAHQLKRARGNAPKARLVRADVRRFSLRQRYDVVSCFFDSLNYLLTLGDLGDALRCARRHLADDGLLVFDVLSPAAFADTRTYAVHGSDWTAVMELAVDKRKSLRTTTITGFVGEGEGLYRRFVEEHVQRAYTAKEVEKVLASLKFGFEKYDGERFQRPHAGFKRLLYLCHRKA